MTVKISMPAVEIRECQNILANGEKCRRSFMSRGARYCPDCRRASFSKPMNGRGMDAAAESKRKHGSPSTTGLPRMGTLTLRKRGAEDLRPHRATQPDRRNEHERVERQEDLVE
jgi:hypothetical protein